MTSTVFTDIDWDKDGKQIGTLNLPHSPDDDAWGVIPFPAASIKNGKGPVVVLTGAVHGDEYEGPIVISELMRNIEAQEVTGQLILLPTFNAPALKAGRRTSPIDQLNLNRVFPGDDYGLPTQQIARYVTDHLFSKANFYIDLHAGGRSLFIQPSAHVVMAEGMPAELIQANARLAEAFGVGITVRPATWATTEPLQGMSPSRAFPCLPPKWAWAVGPRQTLFGPHVKPHTECSSTPGFCQISKLVQAEKRNGLAFMALKPTCLHPWMATSKDTSR